MQEIPTVYAASKYDQKVTEAPSSIPRVTSEEIAACGYRAFRDILQSLPGFYTAYDCNYTYLQARGFARPGDHNSRVPVLVGGHHVNHNIFDESELGTEALREVDLIEWVDVIRGDVLTLGTEGRRLESPALSFSRWAAAKSCWEKAKGLRSRMPAVAMPYSRPGRRPSFQK